MPTTATMTELMKVSMREIRKDICTSIVGHVLAFDPSTQLAQIQIGIQRIDINGKTFDPPPLIQVPVYFTGGTNFFVEHQVDVGTEGIIIFSQRCIDTWIDQGGIAANPILRFHDFSDAMFLCGLRSQPNKITGFSNDGIRIRNKSGSSYVWLKSNGNIYIKGDVIVEGDVVADGISLKSHTHDYIIGNTTRTTEAPN